MALHVRPRHEAHEPPLIRESQVFEQQARKLAEVQAPPSGVQQVPGGSQAWPCWHCSLAVQGAQAWPMQAGVGFAHSAAAQHTPVTHAFAQHRSPVPAATQSAEVAQGHGPQSTGLPHSVCGPQRRAHRRWRPGAPQRFLRFLCVR